MRISGNMEIPNITVNLSEEDRERLDTIINLLKGAEDAAVERVKNLFPQGTAPASPQSAQEQPKPADPNPVPPTQPKAETEPTQSAPEVTAAELQAKVVNLVSNGKKEETRAIIMEYAPRVSDIPSEKRAEVLERLNALEG